MSLECAYQQLCESYRAIDDTRMKLLAALPLASGTGIYLLLNNKDQASQLSEHAPLVGAFGFLVTLGLALYEVYGIRKCHALIETGREIEIRLGVPGQFLTRPQALFGVIKEPLAGGFIYPAVLAAWTLVALPTWQCAWLVALLIFVLGLGLSLGYNLQWHSPELQQWIKDHPLKEQGKVDSQR